MAREHCDGQEPYILRTSNSKNIWWDGYTGQKAIVIDEFYGSWMKYNVLLTILDGYALRLEVKGGFTWASYDMVIITSNATVGEWYSRVDISALNRRIKEVIDVNEPLYDDIELPPDETARRIEHARMRVEVFMAKQREERGVFAEHRKEPKWSYGMAHDGEALAKKKDKGKEPVDEPIEPVDADKWNADAQQFIDSLSE